MNEVIINLLSNLFWIGILSLLFHGAYLVGLNVERWKNRKIKHGQ